MERNNRSLIDLWLNDGLILGVILCVFNAIFYVFIDIEKLSFFTIFLFSIITGFLPLVLGLTYLIKKYKRKQLGGYMKFSQGIRYGTIVTFFAAIPFALYSLVLNNYIDPDYTENTQEVILVKTYEFMEKYNVPENIIEEKIADLEDKIAKEVRGSMIEKSLSSIFNTTLFGFVICLILVVIIKKNKPLIGESN